MRWLCTTSLPELAKSGYCLGAGGPVCEGFPGLALRGVVGPSDSGGRRPLAITMKPFGLPSSSSLRPPEMIDLCRTTRALLSAHDRVRKRREPTSNATDG